MMASEYNDGPDQILPADDYVTKNFDGRVRLRIPDAGKAIETMKPTSIPGLLRTIAEHYPNHDAYAFKADDKWFKVSYKEYLEQVRACAKGFLRLGLERHHSVCILGFNSPEWFISDLGAIFAGGVAVGIYTTNSSEACFHCASYSKANIIVVQDKKQLEKILSIRDRLPHLKAIIQYEGEPSEAGVLSWKDLMTIGTDQGDEKLDEVLKTVAINECCTLVFTSGTVGKPKAVMLSHDNLTWDALGISQRINIRKGEECIVSYLPLSHVAAQVVDIYLVMSNAGCVYFADSNALKGTLLNTLIECRPTKFLGVPRVWEKMHEKMMQIAAQNGSVKKYLAGWAKNQALQYHFSRIKNGGATGPSSWRYYIAKSVIFKRIKQALGLDRCEVFASAAAPLAPEIKKYFLSIDIPIFDCFGMSEASGAHTLLTMEGFGVETIGTTLPGMKSKIANSEDNQGEICMYGRHVFMGYLNDEEKTREAIDADGWLHSGDLGRIDSKGFIYITGRLKELIITAGGENVAPVPIEQMVKAELPHISYAFLVGDKRKFLSVLLTLKTEVDPETNKPLDTLLSSVREWLNSLGCPASTVTEVLQDGIHPKLQEALMEGINRANLQASSNAQRIQKLAILPADFSVPTGELGPTMKVKRNEVLKKYNDIIDKLYA